MNPFWKGRLIPAYSYDVPMPGPIDRQRCSCGLRMETVMMGDHMVACWCQDCLRGFWKSTWSLTKFPSGLLRCIWEFLDAVAGTHASQSSWACLSTPLPEAELTPTPRFMSASGLVPRARRESLTVRVRASWALGRRLHEFALRSAGLRSMFHQVYVQAGLELASRGEVLVMQRGEVLVMRSARHAHRRVQRAGALAVVSLSMTLPEAGSATHLGAFLKATQERAS